MQMNNKLHLVNDALSCMYVYQHGLPVEFSFYV